MLKIRHGLFVAKNIDRKLVLDGMKGVRIYDANKIIILKKKLRDAHEASGTQFVYLCEVFWLKGAHWNVEVI